MLYLGLEDRLCRWKIDIALLPINGRNPDLGVAGSLDGTEAVEVAKDIGVQLVIQCHYDRFEFNTITPSNFIHAAQARSLAFQIIRYGERRSYPPAKEVLHNTGQSIIKAHISAL